MAFRVMENELHWLVPLGETRGTCGGVELEDVIPPANYGGLESPLGCLGYCRGYRCYGVQFTLRAVLDDRRHTPMSASKRAVIQCGRFSARLSVRINGCKRSSRQWTYARSISSILY
jgi:hypothetical protein